MITRWTAVFLSLALAACASGAAQQRDLADCRSEVADLRFRLDTASTKAQQQAPGPAEPTAPQPTVVERLLTDYRQLADQLTSALDGTVAAVFSRDGRLVVQIPNDALFAQNKAELSAAGKSALQRLAPILAGLGGRDVLVASHTDEPTAKAASGKSAASRELTSARAVAVVRFLEKQGVDPSIIGGAGYGWHRPEAGNLSDEGRELNRRTEIVIMPWLDEFSAIAEQL